MRHQNGHLAGVVAEGVRDLLGGEHEASGRVQEEVDRRVGRRHPDGAEDRLRVVDVDVAVERDAEHAYGLLAVDHGDHSRASSPLEPLDRPGAPPGQKALGQHRDDEQHEDEDGEQVADVHARRG
jgi:hypothetical protein